MLKSYIGILVVALQLLPSASLANDVEKPTVVTTIRPLAFIAHQLWGGRVNIKVIIPPGADLHHYQLKPSDIKEMERAERVYWLGNQAEPAMAKVIAKLSPEKVVNVGKNISWITSDDLQHREIDPHAWLSWSNGLLIAKQMSESLELPSDALREALDSQLQALNNRPYLLTHDAFDYLIKEYGLHVPLVLSSTHGTEPSLAQLAALKQQVTTQRIHCAIATPDYNPALLDKVFITAPEIVVIDPLGGQWPVQTDYSLFMQEIAKKFVHCLKHEE